MRITQEMKLRPTENGHILSGWAKGITPLESGFKELNLPADFDAEKLYDAVADLQVIIDKAEMETPAP